MFINNLKAGITILHDTATATDHHLSLLVGCTQKEVLENGYPLLEDKGFIDSAIFWRNAKDRSPGQGKEALNSTEEEEDGDEVEPPTGDGVNNEAGKVIPAPKITVVGTIAPIPLAPVVTTTGISTKEIDPKFIFCESNESEETVAKQSGTLEVQIRPPAAQTITITIPGKDGKTAGTGITGKPVSDSLLAAKIKFLEETQPERKNLAPPFTTTKSETITKSRWMYGAHWVRYNLAANAVFLLNHTGGYDITFAGKPMLRSPDLANPYACICPIFLKPEDGQIGILSPVPGSNPIFMPVVLPEPADPDAIFAEFVKEGGVIPPTPEGIGGGLAGDLLDITKFKDTLKTTPVATAATAEVNITVTDTQAPGIFESFFRFNFDNLFDQRLAQALGFGTTIEGSSALFDNRKRIKLKFQECGQAPPVGGQVSGGAGGQVTGGIFVQLFRRVLDPKTELFVMEFEELPLQKKSQILFSRTGNAKFNNSIIQTVTTLFHDGSSWIFTHFVDEPGPRIIYSARHLNPSSNRPNSGFNTITVFPINPVSFITFSENPQPPRVD